MGMPLYNAIFFIYQSFVFNLNLKLELRLTVNFEDALQRKLL